MADYHGVAIYKDQAYIMETNRNAIGIFDLDNLSRVGQIKISPKDHDVNHANDLFVKGDDLYLSMFYKQRTKKEDMEGLSK